MHVRMYVHMYILHWKSDAVHSLLGFQGLTVLTIEVYLVGLRHFRIQATPTCMAPSLHSPCIKWINSAKEPSRVRLPITATLRGKIKGSLFAKPHQWDNLMVWVACCTGFFGFLRCTEFVAPDNMYLTQDSSKHIRLRACPFGHTALHIITN